jgi:2-polyprenyl-6-methoxyphenol hydroxylase-like FAD-dependent oxidoreductase
MTPRLQVLIVGAGPIGLTLACHLKRLGLSVRVIEKRSGPSVHSKAIGLQYRVRRSYAPWLRRRAPTAIKSLRASTTPS